MKATPRRHQKSRPRRDDGQCWNTAHPETQTKRESRQSTPPGTGVQLSGAAVLGPAVQYVSPIGAPLCRGRRDVFIAARPGQRGGGVVYVASCA